MKALRYFMLALMATLFIAGCGEDPLRTPATPPSSGTEKPGDDGNGGSDGDGDQNDGGFVLDETKEYPFISTYPSFVSPETTETVVVILNGKGTAIEGFNGDLYAHTGVITNLSKDSADWKYVKAGWTENIAACKLKKHGNELWTLYITGGPRAFYGVPAAETIKKLAFVFRSADGSLELKNNGNDIFINTVEEGLSVMIESPKHGSVLTVGQQYNVVVKQQAATSLTLYRNDVVVETTDMSSIEYAFTPTECEDIVFKAVATNGAETVEDSISVAVLGTTQNEPRPAGAGNGVTVNGNEATFVLFAPGKESVILLGDFNDYAPTNAHMMKRDGDYFWTTVTDLQPDVEYGYQFLVDGTIKVGDPYCTKILDPWNDKWIEASVYPNLKQYPSEYTTDIVSVFELNPDEYQWTASNYQRPAENSLAVYELLVRDFTTERSIDAVTAKLDYIETLGVNAIELMPIQEFDGNDSWGYNPCFYFAADKAYGTEEAYKRFIDECHKRGIAVILDVVFNHATGQFPYAKMWWDASNNCTAADNPFFNVSAPHNFSVYHDFKHLYAPTRQYFKDVLQFWLREYKVDGFRFDLTKGFVQNPGNYDAGGYSEERIEILSDYARAIREVEQDAYVIFEHFCAQDEEDKLFNNVGGLCWNNNAYEGYNESVMGWYDSGISGDGTYWGVMGDLQNNNWSQDIALNVVSGTMYVAQDVIFADANKEGCCFKIRKNRDWSTSYGVADKNKKHSLGAAISLNGSANVLMDVSVGVKYDIYFDAASMTVYVMPDGQKPAALAAMQRMMSTRAGENKSSFADFKRGRMNNIETHDEERIGYKTITWGQDYVKGDWAVISKRMQAVYAFHFLTPYPKMMWQFGELGYDFSINANENGVVGNGDEYRTHRKPIRWDYFTDVNRRALYDAMSKFVSWRTDHESYYGQDNLVVHTWNVGDVNMSGKVLVMDKVIVVANFTNAEATTTVAVPSAGEWTNLMTGGAVMLGSTHEFKLAGSDYIILVRE